MKKLIACVICLLAIAACNSAKEEAETKISKCTVTKNPDATQTIWCPDGTSVVVTNGSNGTNGQDGVSCSVANNADQTATITCNDGTSYTVANGQNGSNGVNGTNGTNGVDGTNGLNGTNGSNGTNGANAQPCTVTDNGNGTKTITCPDGTSATVIDGANGQNGANGTNGTSCSVVNNGDDTATINCTDGTSVTFNLNSGTGDDDDAAGDDDDAAGDDDDATGDDDDDTPINLADYPYSRIINQTTGTIANYGGYVTQSVDMIGGNVYSIEATTTSGTTILLDLTSSDLNLLKWGMEEITYMSQSTDTVSLRLVNYFGYGISNLKYYLKIVERSKTPFTITLTPDPDYRSKWSVHCNFCTNTLTQSTYADPVLGDMWEIGDIVDYGSGHHWYEQLVRSIIAAAGQTRRIQFWVESAGADGTIYVELSDPSYNTVFWQPVNVTATHQFVQLDVVIPSGYSSLNWNIHFGSYAGATLRFKDITEGAIN